MFEAVFVSEDVCFMPIDESSQRCSFGVEVVANLQGSDNGLLRTTTAAGTAVAANVTTTAPPNISKGYSWNAAGSKMAEIRREPGTSAARRSRADTPRGVGSLRGLRRRADLVKAM
ncbi:MAG: hypothetical protein M3619_28745 [Myxococcota bacterium]|nr:hypothetical protein [Myxococcota bacterium]